MTHTNHRRLVAKARQFEQLYRKETGTAIIIEFGEDTSEKFFVILHKNFPDGTPDDYRAESPTLNRLEAYFNDKIKLFRG